MSETNTNGGFYGWMSGHNNPTGGEKNANGGKSRRAQAVKGMAVDKDDSDTKFWELLSLALVMDERNETRKKFLNKKSSAKPNEDKARKVAREFLGIHRNDLDKEQIETILDQVFLLDTAKERTAALHWLANGSVRFPDDMKKVRRATRYAEKKHINARDFPSPDELTLFVSAKKE